MKLVGTENTRTENNFLLNYFDLPNNRHRCTLPLNRMKMKEDFLCICFLLYFVFLVIIFLFFFGSLVYGNNTLNGILVECLELILNGIRQTMYRAAFSIQLSEHSITLYILTVRIT